MPKATMYIRVPADLKASAAAAAEQAGKPLNVWVTDLIEAALVAQPGQTYIEWVPVAPGDWVEKIVSR